jgi:site-specific DNA recombinase
MKIAAIYARVSSDKQKEENTIASQTAALIEFARNQGYDVPGEWVFEDEGFSGASLVRPGLERLRDLAAEGQVETILVYAPDRLSRKYAYQILLVEEFARNGVEIVFVKAPQSATPEDQLLVQFQGMIAEYERAQILERSRRGKRHRARQGQISVLSGAPYGYRYVRKSDETAAYYQIIEAEADVVRLVYERYTGDRLSIGAITRWLNEQGVPTRKRISRWERSTVWAMLRNPAYRGTACFGKTEIRSRQRVTRPLRMRGGVAKRNSANHERPRTEWIEIPVPAIVSEETFALAQELLTANKTHAPRRTIEPSICQGVVSCSKCGYALYRTSTRSSARRIHYYRCLGSDAWRHLNGAVCNNRPVRQDLLDQVVWSEIVRLLEDPRLIDEELNRRLEVAQKAAPTKRRQETLQRDRTRLGKSIERLLTAYQEDLLSLDELRSRMPELRQREQAMHAELQSIAIQAHDRAAYLRLAETLSAFLSRLRSSAETLNVLERQRIVRLLVKEVLVGDDAIVIRHSIPVTAKPPRDEEPPKSSKSGVSEREGYLLRSGRDLTAPGEPVPALCLRHVDGADVSAHSVRALRGRCHLSLQERRGGAGTLECDCRPLRGLQAGAASAEDEDRLLQGCEPEGRLPRHPLRLPGLPVSSSEDDVGEGGQAHLRAQLPACRQPEGADAHQPNSPAMGASSSQRQVPAGSGRDVQPVHPRLDHLLQPLLQDAAASDPETDRCLCHPVGTSQVQADAPPDQGRERLV